MQPSIKHNLNDYKCYIELTVKYIKKFILNIIAEKFDKDQLYDSILDYIKYFNNFYKVQVFESFISSNQIHNDVLRFTKKSKISKATNITNSNILYSHKLSNIESILPNCSKNTTILFELDLKTLKKNINLIQHSIVVLLYYFKKVYLWKSSFDFTMSTIYFIAEI